MRNKFLNDQSGATAIEYGLIAALIAIGIISSTTILAEKLGVVFTIVVTSL